MASMEARDAVPLHLLLQNLLGIPLGIKFVEFTSFAVDRRLRNRVELVKEFSYASAADRYPDLFRHRSTIPFGRAWGVNSIPSRLFLFRQTRI